MTPEAGGGSVVGMDTGVIVCLTRCVPCQFQQHPGGPHWADDEDRAHAAATGQPEPTGQCGCHCTADPPYEMEPDGPDLDFVPLSAGPCSICGEHEACGYDNEGRALIHALGWDEDEPDEVAL